MPGNYSHITRADGTILTAAIYNQDHQNHINNMTPAGVDDFSATLTEMRSTVDPGETGSESFATSLGGELQRLRFAIQEIKSYLGLAGTYWYNSPSGLLAPSLINDHSANVAQMQQTTNPGTTGSESLATDLRGELERLRYVVHQIKNAYQPVTNWYDPMPTLQVGPAGSAIRGLQGSANGNTVTLSVQEVRLRDANGNHVWKTNSGNVTADQTVVGVNGRDTSAPLSATGFAYVYWIWGSTPNVLRLLLSNTPPPTGPTLPTGYTHWAFATMVYNVSSAFRQSVIRGKRVSWPSRPTLHTDTSTGNVTDVAFTAPFADFQESTTLTLHLTYELSLGSGSQAFNGISTVSSSTGTNGELYCQVLSFASASVSGRHANTNTVDLPAAGTYYFSMTRNTSQGAFTSTVMMSGYTVQNGA